jgi:pimeloyl-ACP methyl ester carboxylesterase
LLRKIDIPLLIIWGKQDQAIDVNIGQKLHEELVGSQFIVIDEAGHCSNIDQPEQFNKLVMDFLV